MNDQVIARFFADAQTFATAAYTAGSGRPETLAAFLLAQATFLVTKLNEDAGTDAADKFLDVFDEGFDLLVGDQASGALSFGS